MVSMRIRGVLGGILFFLLLGACSKMPVNGPSAPEISDNAARDRDYALVNVSGPVLQQLDAVRPPSFIRTFGNSKPAPVRTIGPGDVLSITVWDAGGGLFSPQGPGQVGTQVTPVPNQIVDPKGEITVPFAGQTGQIKVAGLTTSAAQQRIIKALASQVVNPQALVTIVTDQKNLITIIGDVKSPGEIPLDINGTHVLTAIAKAGGSAAPAFDTTVQLTRKGVMKRVRLSSLLDNPSENIYLEPGDTVYVLRDPQSVIVLGAAKNNTRMPFDSEKLTLAEVLGQSGGLVDELAEPTGVFVFRMESTALVNALSGTPVAAPPRTDFPVIFQADLRQPQGFFLARSFKMHDKDIVYVANAEVVQVDKVLKVLLHAAEIVGIAIRGGTNVSTSP